jgi:hypothetical protein
MMDNKKFPSVSKIKTPTDPMELARSEAIDHPHKLYMYMSLSDEEIENLSKATLEQSYCQE